MNEWVEALTRVLELPGDVDVKSVLDVARDVAHNVERPAAPISTYLVGVAVGRGMSPEVAVERVQQLVQTWPASEADQRECLVFAGRHRVVVGEGVADVIPGWAGSCCERGHRVVDPAWCGEHENVTVLGAVHLSGAQCRDCVVHTERGDQASLPRLWSACLAHSRRWGWVLRGAER